MELSKQRAEIIAARYPDADNLEILIGNFEDIRIEEKIRLCYFDRCFGICRSFY